MESIYLQDCVEDQHETVLLTSSVFQRRGTQVCKHDRLERLASETTDGKLKYFPNSSTSIIIQVAMNYFRVIAS